MVRLFCWPAVPAAVPRQRRHPAVDRVRPGDPLRPRPRPAVGHLRRGRRVRGVDRHAVFKPHGIILEEARKVADDFGLPPSTELKRALVDFALSPRMEPHLERFMGEGAGPDEVLIEDEAIDAIDRFALLYHLPNGKTVLDQFLASWPDLSAFADVIVPIRPDTEVAAAVRIEQGRAHAGRVEAGAAESVHGAVRRHERGRLQISYQRMITNVGVAGHHAFLPAARHRQSRGRQLDGPRTGLWAKTATILRRRRICRLTPVGVTCRAAGLALRPARRKDSRRLGPSSMSDTSPQSPCIRRHVAGGWAPARSTT